MTLTNDTYRCDECDSSTIIFACGRWLCVEHVKPVLAEIRAKVEAEWDRVCGWNPK